MLVEYQKKALKMYHKQKEKNKLSNNLLHPTTANLRNECALIFSKRPNENIKNTLESFGGIAFNITIAEDIQAIDPDKFRPLQNLIQGEIILASIHNIKLLAWLIDLNLEESEVSNFLALLKEKKLIVSSFILVTILGLSSYFIGQRKQCMYWTGERYEAISCDAPSAGKTIIALDSYKLAHLKKITRPDTLTRKHVGKVWYIKINSIPEFYTDSGEYPLDTRRVLKPLTDYMLTKYTPNK